MITKDQIRIYLKENPYWEPDDDTTYKVWELFDEVCDEIDRKNENYDKDNNKDPEWPNDDEYL